MPTARTHPIDREHAAAERCPAAPAPAIALDPRALERRIAERPERLHAMTTERSILATVAMRRISL
jgi:hypothetical protein